jgi:sulfite exporter TauE/SafE
VDDFPLSEETHPAAAERQDFNVVQPEIFSLDVLHSRKMQPISGLIFVGVLWAFVSCHHVYFNLSQVDAGGYSVYNPDM